MEVKFKFFIFLILILSSQIISYKGTGSDGVIEKSNIIKIQNGPLELNFLSAESGFGLSGIINTKTGYNFLKGEAQSKNLWKIKLKDAYNEFITIDNTVKCDQSYKIEHLTDDNGITLHLYWNGIEIGGEEDAMDVMASVRVDEFGMSYWKIKVNNNSKEFGQRGKGFGVWDVIYPAVRGLKAAKNDNMHLALPRYLGQLIKNPVERMPFDDGWFSYNSMIYPSHRAKMQFNTFFKSDGSNGLYLGTFDPEAYQKEFRYDLDQKDASLKYEIKHYPEGMGLSANGYEMPYEAVIGVYEGDWKTAAKIYRNWAVNQFWTSKGKLSERDDIPQWYKNTVLWFSGHPTGKMVPLANYLDVPIAYQWYNWHEIEFDSQYPDYFPAKSGFNDERIKLQNAGIKITPYINSRLWEVNSKSWQEEHPYPAATKVLHQVLNGLSVRNWGPRLTNHTIYHEAWEGYKHAVMCPTTKIWQNKQSEIITRLATEFHVDGVYMDQLASWLPILCFDPGHGHTLGGGNYWVKGYRKMIELSHENARKINPETILTSEGHAEVYLDLLDGNLACNSVSVAPELIPMFHYVYSGYALTFGRATGRWHTEWDGDAYTTGLPLMMRNAQMFTWGEQLGWFNPNVLDLPSPEAEYIKVLSQALKKESVKKFLFYGEMVRPPVLEGDIPILAAKWRAGQEATKMPAVMHSAWKGEDGSLGLVFTNIDSISHTVSYELDVSDYQTEVSAKYIMRTMDGEIIGNYNSQIINRTEKIPPRSAIILEVIAK